MRYARLIRRNLFRNKRRSFLKIAITTALREI
jgi:hypothetical protein